MKWDVVAGSLRDSDVSFVVRSSGQGRMLHVVTSASSNGGISLGLNVVPFLSRLSLRSPSAGCLQSLLWTAFEDVIRGLESLGVDRIAGRGSSAIEVQRNHLDQLSLVELATTNL
jgi:hypothetical protein